MLTLAGRAGIFIPLLLTSCYVQWRRRAERHTINPVMVFTTVFYGLTVTAVRGIQHMP
jgi:Na+-translocating ferredoxin:NAD+ oxidoreductase RnfE subunit